jgi:hypothetical protein
MIWLTWRQFRVNATVLYVPLLVFAAALVLTGPHLADVYGESASTFLDWIAAQGSDKNLYTVGSVAGYVVPGLVGVFWGAPMIAREVEAGTHRLIWTQSITRNRWLATKLGLGMLGAMAAGGLVGLALTWWAHPIDKAVNSGGSDTGSIFSLARVSPELFGTRGMAPIGYAALAFAFGVLAGAMIRRTVPAMALTLVVYLVVQVAMPMWVRPHLVAPTEKATAITAETLQGIMGQGPGLPIEQLDVAFDVAGAWKLSNHTVDANGKPVDTFPSWVSQCLPEPGTERAPVGARERGCFDRLTSAGYRQQVTYQPASHYWALQWRETGVLFAGALGLVGLCFWRVRRLS